MRHEIITVFGCERDEGALFEQYAERMGINVFCIGQPLGIANARVIPLGSAVSVSHRQTVDARLIRALQGRGVRYLSSRSVGLNHVDLDAARRAGIAAENVAYSPQSVAEYTVMLMLMAIRNAGSILRRASHSDFRLEERRAMVLRDMTIGVVGTGRIGKAVIELLSGFGCAIVACDPHPSASVTYTGLDSLLASSDLVSLHMPLTPGTHHLMDRARIANMRRGAMLVNAARGALVDTSALADALDDGHIACAALDVIEGEEGWFYRDCSGSTPPFARLQALPNAIITPHTAFYTEHALDDIVRNTIHNCMECAGGKTEWVS